MPPFQPGPVPWHHKAGLSCRRCWQVFSQQDQLTHQVFGRRLQHLYLLLVSTVFTELMSEGDADADIEDLSPEVAAVAPCIARTPCLSRGLRACLRYPVLLHSGTLIRQILCVVEAREAFEVKELMSGPEFEEQRRILRSPPPHCGTLEGCLEGAPQGSPGRWGVLGMLGVTLCGQ